MRKMNFKELLTKKEILRVLEEKKYETPTEIQEKIIPLILDGNDVLGKSQTGTGKTLAFAAPILEKIKENKEMQAMILAPTRELAIQIAREIEEYSQYMKIKTVCVYGSSSISSQIKELKNGPEIVIGTPGRVKDLIKRGVLKLSKISFFVLDEADEMLSMGFQEELEFIFEKTNNDKQVLLFSATMPKSVLTIAQKYMSLEYKLVSVVSDTKTAANIAQSYYIINDRTRLESMCRIMDMFCTKKVIIFCRTKRNADELFEKLSNKGYNADIIHGDITQSQRIATLDRFKSGVFNYLIATDVAARGIHVDDIDVVVNYNLPESSEAYVHRIGRTGRVNKNGLAITLIKQNEENIIVSLEKVINAKIVKQILPDKEEILASRLVKITEIIEKLKLNRINVLDDYLENLNTNELKNIASQLLYEKVITNLGSNFDIDVTVKNKKQIKAKNRNLGNSVRIFLTIGKIDKIDKRELLNFIEKKANIKEGTCSGVEIMTKFTFMNVKEDAYDKVFNSCNNIKYKNRVIRIEKAKK